MALVIDSESLNGLLTCGVITTGFTRGSTMSLAFTEKGRNHE